MQEEQEKPRFLYWKFAVRAQAPMLMLHAAGLDYVWDDATANTWPGPKENMPFGQLPVLFHDGKTIAQSGTIARYCARLAGLWPQDEDGWLKADMLIEHSNDILMMMAKAKYAGDVTAQRKAWAELAEKKYPEHLAWLEKMIGEDLYFGKTVANAGDIAVFSVINLAERAGVACPLSKFPRLLAHSKRVSQLGTIGSYLAAEHPLYLSVPAEEEEGADKAGGGS